jgi:GNAT superfamily N-acetyltransferase
MNISNLGCFSIDSLRIRSRLIPWSIHPFLRTYYLQRRGGSPLEGLRVGPNPFTKAKVHWILAQEKGKAMGHAVYGDCLLPSGFQPSDFGWHGIVDLIAAMTGSHNTPDAAIGLFVLTEPAARGSGVARALLSAMRTSAFASGVSRLLIPLLLPVFTSQEGCLQAPESVAFRLRDDECYQDLWLRLHASLGARIMGFCSTSHVYALSTWQMDAWRNDDRRQLSLAVHADGHEGFVLKDGARHYFFRFCPGAKLWVCHVPCLWVAHEPT